ncbi:MAG: DUF5916 domain-containing protein, partial [Candidatus Poribacteria bacterium]
IQAVRVNHPPKIDGVLDDAVWQEAPIATGFTQRDPNEGEPATEKTTFQVAYDDEALYVGVVCYDNEPGRIVSRLARRDHFIDREVDRITVLLDPYHDHQTGYYFMVYASGTMVDAAIYDDSRFDGTWDGVWQARVAINKQGWSVEYKIPYHVLRFSPKEEYTWGMNVDRVISRKNENCYWVLRPKNKSGVASRFGHLEGIKGIRPSKHLEFLPFTLAKTTFEPESMINPDGRELFSSAGLDLRYGVSSNLSLNATFNPDFGQVEADPAVLNLSVFETFFEERRPFFVEGAQIFRTPIGLFYSRRIGRRPGLLKIPAGSREIERPAATTILGAAKLTGKTKSKTSIGILNAVTAAEYATIETESGRREHRIEPMTNYFVSRLQQDILDGNSTVGALATAVNSDVAPAYTGGLDWDLRWRNNSYRFLGQVAGSRAGRSENRQSGYAMQMRMAKQSGWVQGDFGFAAFSPEFNANDLGFIRRVNRLSPSLRIQLRKIKPWGPFHQIYLNTLGSFAWNYRHKWTEKLHRWVNLEKALSFDFSAQLKNFWWLKSGLAHHFERMDDLDTRGGPLIVKPKSTYIWVFLKGDDRLAIIPNLFFELTGRSDGGVGGNLAPSVRVKPASNVEFNIGPSYSWNLNKAQWVTNVDDDGDGMPEHYVYGELESHIFDLTTRVNVTFTPNLSLQFYMQPFVAVGDYQNIKELARPSSYKFTPYTALNFNPDFSRRSLRSNLVLRWEYRPGSALFLVWSQNRSKSLDTANPRFEPLDNLRNSFTDEGQNIFLVKLNYWLGI